MFVATMLKATLMNLQTYQALEDLLLKEQRCDILGGLLKFEVLLTYQKVSVVHM